MDYKNLNAATRERLGQFAGGFDLMAWKGRPMGAMFNSLLSDVGIAHSEELDPATQGVIEQSANRLTRATVEAVLTPLTETQMDQIFGNCAAELFTGYLVGRSMLGTEREALHYSDEATQGENTGILLRRLEDMTTDDRLLSDAGAVPLAWEHFREAVAAQSPFSVLPIQHAEALSKASARTGMTIAVLEHDTFVERGGASVVPPDDLEGVAKLVLAALKVNESMGFDDLAPGTGALALQTVDEMRANKLIYKTGDADGFRKVVAAMPKSLSVSERELLGFSPSNNYPARAVEYLKALVITATELGFTDYSEDFVQMIRSKPAGN